LLRSVKYGLWGGVLVALVAGTTAWTATDKTVTLVVDGQQQSVHTTAAQVSGVLATAGYQLGSHDLLAPGRSSPVHNGSRVVLERGRLLHLNVDGTPRDVWTTAPTVAEAVAELGYSSASYVSVSRDQRLPLSPTALVVRTPHTVTVVHDGRRQQAQTTDATVGALLADMHVAVDGSDKVAPGMSADLVGTRQIVIIRVDARQLVVSRMVPFPTTHKQDAGLLAGKTKTVRAGKAGLAKITYTVVYVDGKATQKTKVGTTIVRKPQPAVVKVGTKPAPEPASPGSSSAVSSGSALAIGKRLAAARGWTGNQFNCLDQLWSRESGWNVHAGNAVSGAYGIPQALPGQKMASAGPDWQDNASTQITWGLNYVAGRYGSPCSAWSAWQSQGWY